MLTRYIVILLASVASPALPATTSISATGFVYYSEGVFASAFPRGTEMSATIRYDLSRADRVVEFASDRFFYYGAIDSFRISVAGFNFSLKHSGSARIEVSGGTTNRVIFETLGAASVDFAGASFFDHRPLSSLSLSFNSIVPSKVGGTALMPKVRDLGATSDVRFRAISRDLSTQDDLGASAASVTVAAVPLPPTGILSAMALAILCALRRIAPTGAWRTKPIRRLSDAAYQHPVHPYPS